MQILSAQTEKQKQLERERQELLHQISQINELRQTNKRKEINVLNQVEDLAQKIKAREDLIRVTNRQANLLTGEINKNLKKISALRDELEQLKNEYAELIRKSYKSKSSQSRIMFLLSSESFTQAYKRVQYLKQYNNYRRKQGELIQERAALLQKTNSQLTDQKAEKVQLIAENQKEQAQLKEEKKQQDGLMATIKKKKVPMLPRSIINSAQQTVLTKKLTVLYGKLSPHLIRRRAFPVQIREAVRLLPLRQKHAPWPMILLLIKVNFHGR